MILTISFLHPLNPHAFRELRIVGQIPVNLDSSGYKFEVISSQYLFCISKPAVVDNSLTMLFLLKLDFNSWTFEFVHTTEIIGHYSNVELISADPDRLIFYTSDGSANYFYFGKLANSRFELTKRSPTQYMSRGFNGWQILSKREILRCYNF